MEARRSRRRGRGGGCGLTLLLILIAVGVTAVILGTPIWEAKHTEQRLNEQCGDAPTFVPAPDGSIAPNRIEAFLRVRERVNEHCPIIHDKLLRVMRLDELEESDSLPPVSSDRTAQKTAASRVA